MGPLSELRGICYYLAIPRKIGLSYIAILGFEIWDLGILDGLELGKTNKRRFSYFERFAFVVVTEVPSLWLMLLKH